ncbi:hypothetical protein CsatB_028178 [Cannabis sativa]
MPNRPVAFKRESDGKFITAVEIDDRVFLKFTDSRISDPNVQHQVYPLPRTGNNDHDHTNNNVLCMIQSVGKNKLWKYDPVTNFIIGVQNSDPQEESDYVFEMIDGTFKCATTGNFLVTDRNDYVVSPAQPLNFIEVVI